MLPSEFEPAYMAPRLPGQSYSEWLNNREAVRIIAGDWCEEHGLNREAQFLRRKCPLDMVWCPAGEFVSKANSQAVATDKMIEKGFWIATAPLTVFEFNKFGGRRSSSQQLERNMFNTETYKSPVTRVSIVEARNFCDRLSNDHIRKGYLPPFWEYRLPTKYEWEYACRAGTTTKWSFGDDPKELRKYAWYGGLGRIHPHYSPEPTYGWCSPIKLKKPNPWGLYDMHGNVWEYTCTNYNETSLFSESGDRMNHVIVCGGSWCCDEKYTACESNTSVPWHHSSGSVGFRVALAKSPFRTPDARDEYIVKTLSRHSTLWSLQ